MLLTCLAHGPPLRDVRMRSHMHISSYTSHTWDNLHQYSLVAVSRTWRQSTSTLPSYLPFIHSPTPALVLADGSVRTCLHDPHALLIRHRAYRTPDVRIFDTGIHFGIYATAENRKGKKKLGIKNRRRVRENFLFAHLVRNKNSV